MPSPSLFMAPINHGGTFYRLIAVGKSDMNWKPRPTDLRHFFASYLVNNGEDHLVVANLMGHSSVNMLRKRYGHYGDDRLKKAMKLFDTNSTKLPQQDVN